MASTSGIDAALAALLKATGAEPRISVEKARADGYVSNLEYAVALGLSKGAAQRKLGALYQEGKLERVRLRTPGTAYAYRSKR